VVEKTGAAGYTAASREDKLKAVDLNSAWDAARKGLPARRKPGETPLGRFYDTDLLAAVCHIQRHGEAA
jgi:hypothetical protein